MKENEELLEWISIAGILCDGYLDMPSGCEGCPLFDEDEIDEDGNCICALQKAMKDREGE